MDLFESGWRRSGFGTSDDELQFRDRAREAMRLYWEREREAEGEPVWLERKFDFQIGEHQVRGRVDRVDRLPDGELRADRLQDRRAQERGAARERPAAGALPARRPRGLGARGRAPAATTTCSTPTRSRRRSSPTTPSGSSAPCSQVGEGVLSQDFEPRPSPNGLQLVRLPADLPGGRELVPAGRLLIALLAQEAAGTRGRSSRRRAGPRPHRSCSTCSASIRSTSSSISGLAAIARPICSS